MGIIAKVLNVSEKKIESNGKEYNIKELNLELVNSSVGIEDKVNNSKGFIFKYATYTIFKNDFQKEIYENIQKSDLILIEEATYMISMFKKRNSNETGFQLNVKYGKLKIILNIDDKIIEKMEKKGINVDKKAKKDIEKKKDNLEKTKNIENTINMNEVEF